MKTFRNILARSIFLGCLGLAASAPTVFAPPAALGQAKEPTDGFFDVPARDPSEVGPDLGVPAYLVTSFLGGLAIFILCKSARRG